MRYSLSSRFARLTLAAFVALLALAWVGRVNALQSLQQPCRLWAFCLPASAVQWLRLAHLLLAALTGALVLWTAALAWRVHRENRLLLPLTTVVVVLFFGQALVGAVLVSRGWPLHLVGLHALTAIALWIALAALVFVGGVTPDPVSATARRLSRRRAVDFLALTKPLIVGLLLVTTYAGLVAGSGRWPELGLTAWTLLGGALAAGGSSALNQYIDRGLDRRMQRTAKRPLAEGRLTPAEGLSFGLALSITSYYVVASFVNFLAALLCLTGIIYYVLVYSMLLKKATVQNIVIGGGAGAIPPMVGWAAATGELSLTAALLFAIVFMWTPPHFWALALVRRRDYERAGVPMLPVVRGEAETRKQILIYSVLLVAISLVLPAVGLAGWIFTAAAVIFGAALLVAAYGVWRTGGNRMAWGMYRWSSVYLALIFVAVIVDTVV